jgi:hypothetical protein
MENSRQILQVWTCSRTGRVHLLPSVCQFACRISAVNIWSKERIITFIEDLQSNVCLWDGHSAHYKTRNRKGEAIDFLAKNVKSALLKLRKKSAISKVSFGESIKKL